ncbi:hypothetical protein GGTG_06139 [Gaeumannomyces tritici R3-111a-1]|uniref:Uncharacterized protein n=1 Tax=Gaeumannomyces tritici (strain R3-111a-1) TaxID=644352 RepID=J3NXY4_GAET3|nr:hypothetical protein GGTG_06139 [Gaeumannomyces tritici R3-111a-1]EJT76217.1 hypothetical protein GGTG_06139 [Gaeumannomyces tritici R3-111a-1]
MGQRRQHGSTSRGRQGEHPYFSTRLLLDARPANNCTFGPGTWGTCKDQPRRISILHDLTIAD